MSELVYVKGEGWVYPSWATYELRMMCGNRVRVEVGPPNPGELYRHGPREDTEFIENNLPTTRWFEYLKYVAYLYMSPIWQSDNKVNPNDLYLTLVPL